MQRTVHFVINSTDSFLPYYSHVISRLVASGVPVRGYAPKQGGSSHEQPEPDPFLFEPTPFLRTTRSPAPLARSAIHAWRLGNGDPEGIFTLLSVAPHMLYGIPLRFLNRRCVFIAAGTGTIFSSQQLRHRLARRVATYFYRFLYSGRNSRVVVQNRDDLRFVIETLKAAPGKAFVMPGWGVDRTRFPFFTHLPATPRPVILVPARLVRGKGIFEAAEASSLLRERGIDHEMWFAGGVDPGSPLTLSEQELKELAGRNDRLRFLGWQQQMAPLYKACHIVCLPSYSEGLPSVLLEASACGRPIVTTDVQGCREVVTHEVTGLLVPPRSAGALADGLQKLVQDPSLADLLRRNAYHQLFRRFTKEKSLSAILPVYRDLGLDIPSDPNCDDSQSFA